MKTLHPRNWPWWVWPAISAAISPMATAVNINIENWIRDQNFDRLYESPQWLKLLRWVLENAPPFALGACTALLLWHFFGPDRQRLTITMPSPKTAKNWHEIYRKRDKLKVSEAASLLAKVLPVFPLIEPAAIGYAEALRDGMRSGQIGFDRSEPNPLDVMNASFSGNSNKHWMETQISRDALISREDVARYLYTKNFKEEALILGWTEKMASISSGPTPSPIVPSGLYVGQTLISVSRLDEFLLEITIRLYNATGGSVFVRGSDGKMAYRAAGVMFEDGPILMIPKVGTEILDREESRFVLEQRIPPNAKDKLMSSLRLEQGVSITQDSFGIEFARSMSDRPIKVSVVPSFVLKVMDDAPVISVVASGVWKAGGKSKAQS